MSSERAPIEPMMLFRSATPTDVRFDKREIDVLAVPYGVATTVRDYDGAQYSETIAPGAFGDTIAARANRIKVFRDHRPERAVGKCVSLDAGRHDGLHATLQITRGVPLCDETLALAADGVLDVSIGFTPRAQTWNADRSAVTRTSVWLHELSLVPLPAYETATVLAVRQQVPAVDVAPRTLTPRLDEVTAWLSEMRYRDQPNRTNRDEASPPLTTA